ncbi:PREDICTED: autophagy-related protein 18h-like [Tarenaya hassleriana]|uniref:autophagy-related protein 18h-like n=1 Tax=Tarenaya hassleriana TaxID=28532 RepID=UPI00053C1D8D|nr:PREDICTED: autophagy-related protein 18h-like [Tarenaya hassleriana]
MRKSAKFNNKNGDNHSKNGTNGLLPSSLKIISTFIRTASSGVRSASASVAASLSGESQEQKDQVLWSSFDVLHTDASSFKHVHLLGYSNGFQVLDVNDAANVRELVSRRDDPVTFLQMQSLPAKCEGIEGFRSSHPILLVVADESKGSGPIFTARDGSIRNGYEDPRMGNLALSPTVVRFYSLRSHNYVHVLRFRSTVYMVRCSPRVVAVGLGSQIYCFDALTLENKFSVLSYPVPQFGSQGISGVNIGYGPMAVGPRWLAYASNNPLSSSTGRLSPQTLTSPGVSPSTSPSNGNLVARYAMESSKHLATGLINLGDKGYKTLSKYCQDLKHDGTGSPVSSSSSWKVGRAASQSAETDVAGTVVIKDFESRAIISQFKAHTSPISALCFDPSGTLLVTASIHGNNINVFRIMPASSKSRSGTRSYDWSSSHVHLYKLHRGMTSAVIQDICFSHYSQWVAIVSSKGTCHIFVLSPFGGENVLEIRNSHASGSVLAPSLSLPWWSSSSFTTNHFSPPPPASVNLTVISRIKSNNFLQAASSVAGKPSFPSGALAVVFHQSVPAESLSDHALEYLLVYTPSGHVVQYKLVPPVGGDLAESNSRIGAVSLPTSEEELRVKVEPVQCWDVCRRTDWPEREENIHGLTLGGRETADIIMDASDGEDNDIGHKELVKPPEKHQVYLANAEVQINSGRRPIWQNSKISFYSMCPPEVDGENSGVHRSGGETEIEKVSTREIEIKKKDLLPVFDNFNGVYSSMGNRGLTGERYPDSLYDPDQMKENPLKGISYLAIGSGNESDDRKRSRHPSFGVHIQNQSPPTGVSSSRSFKQPVVSISPSKETDYVDTDLPAGRTIADSSGTSEASTASSNRSDMSMNVLDEGTIDESPNFEQFFKEGYYATTAPVEAHESAEIATEADNDDAPSEREKSEEGGDDDDMLGGIFAFSEEG